jgi:hypothetical protein
LFIVLGIDAGGIELAGGVKESATINLKVASSGVAVFVLGASMAAAGGLLPNKYTTLGVPGYVAKAHISSMDGRSLQELSTTCEKDAATPEDIRRCVQAARSMLDAKE